MNRNGTIASPHGERFMRRAVKKYLRLPSSVLQDAFASLIVHIFILVGNRGAFPFVSILFYYGKNHKLLHSSLKS